jgi:hypothetical protein
MKSEHEMEESGSIKKMHEPLIGLLLRILCINFPQPLCPQKRPKVLRQTEELQFIAQPAE